VNFCFLLCKQDIVGLLLRVALPHFLTMAHSFNVIVAWICGAHKVNKGLGLHNLKTYCNFSVHIMLELFLFLVIIVNPVPLLTK
jgi:hypothetical protein